MSGQDHLAGGIHGLITVTPQLLKSSTFAVADLAPDSRANGCDLRIELRDGPAGGTAATDDVDVSQSSGGSRVAWRGSVES